MRPVACAMFAHIFSFGIGHLLVVSAVSCAVSRRMANISFTAEEPCEAGVNHCLLTLTRTAGGEYERHGYGCWPWRELDSECPDREGVCRILHVTGDHLYKTCCCLGSMCNNRTLSYLSSTNATATTNRNLNHLGKFGIRDASSEQDAESHSLIQLHQKSFALFDSKVIRAILFTVGVLILLSVIVVLLRLCSYPRSASFSGNRRLNSAENTQNARSKLLKYCPFQWANSFSRYSPRHGSEFSLQPPKSYKRHEVGSVGELVDVTSTSRRRIFPNFSCSDFDILQFIAESCSLEKRLGRGRFAEVWLARLSRDVLSSAIKKFHKEDGLSWCADTTPDKPLTQAPCNISGYEPSSTQDYRPPLWQRLCRGHEDNSQNANIHWEGLRNSSCVSSKPINDASDSEDKLEKVTLLSDSASSGPAREHLGVAKPQPEKSLQVAVKLFPPAEHRAWSSEVAVFGALQEKSLLELVEKSGTTFDLATFHGSHPNLVALYGAGVITTDLSQKGKLASEYRLVIEFAHGGSLHDYLVAGNWIPLKRMLRLSRDITAGLAYLHSDISEESISLTGWTKVPVAHRDLKPENILLRSDGTACLSDFGQGVLLDSSVQLGATASESCSSAHDVLNSIASPNSNIESIPKAGTARYMAPELLDGAINFNGLSLLRTDIYSLGLILWELLTAVPSANSETMNPNNKDIENEESITHIPLVGDLQKESRKFDSVSPSHTELLLESIEPSYATLSPTGNTSIDWQSLSCGSKRHHWLPYEQELGPKSSSMFALRQWVSVEKQRPKWRSCGCKIPCWSQLQRTIAECWDSDPEARLTANCVLERIVTLLAELSKSGTHDSVQPS
ncbi:unnamed protein product [Calicophoron daubneyi]|uniref:receptor protein serine/threonine kinase n=1 Tax=Calicophoron daubneyi TaxID=300641 RepID=A0AAV2T273_CALDB